MNGQRYEIVVPNWSPTPLNKLLGCHWGTRSRLKRADADLVAVYAMRAGVPRATGRRRVTLRLTLGPRQRAPDPDSLWKSLLDALVRAGLLVDDDRFGVELGEVTFERGPEPATVIVLEDLDSPPAQGEYPSARAAGIAAEIVKVPTRVTLGPGQRGSEPDAYLKSRRRRGAASDRNNK
jgi:Holliday junction resolvase RusA-like endonuclease